MTLQVQPRVSLNVKEKVRFGGVGYRELPMFGKTNAQCLRTG